MYAAIKLHGSSKLLNYRFLAHGLTSVSYSQRGSDTNRCGTPAQSDRFTLHCQPRDQVFWQCSTYWYRNNRFIYYTCGYNSSRIQTTSRHGGTGCAATLSTLFMSHLGASIRRRTLWQRNDGVMELHSTGTLLGHGLVREVRHNQLLRCSFSCIWHDTPGQYSECTCKHTIIKT